MATKICGKCERENPSDAVFCNYCGEKLNIVEEMKEEENIRENKKYEIYSFNNKRDKIKKIVLGIAILLFIVAVVYCVNNRDIGADTKKQIMYNDATTKEKQVFEYALGKTAINKNIVKSVKWQASEKVSNDFKLVVEVDNSFDELAESDKFNILHTLDKILTIDGILLKDGSLNKVGLKYNEEIYFLYDVRLFHEIIFTTEQHQYGYEKVSNKNYIDEKEINFTDEFNIEEIKDEMISLGLLVNPVSQTKNDTKSQTKTKTESAESHISVSVSGATSHFAQSEEISVNVYNNSDYDIEYIRINLYEKYNGKIVSSDWTNDSSIIKAGAKQVISTYYDFSYADSELEAEVDDVTFK